MKAKTAVTLLTIYLVIYAALFQYQVPAFALGILFLISPVLIILTVLIVLYDDSVPYPELKQDEEWGYLDKSKGELKGF